MIRPRHRVLDVTFSLTDPKFPLLVGGSVLPHFGVRQSRAAAAQFPISPRASS